MLGISGLIDHLGMGYTSHTFYHVKTLGLQQATAAPISFGVDDPLTLPFKGWPVQDAEQSTIKMGMYSVEKLHQSIGLCYAASEYLRQEMHLQVIGFT